MRHLPASALAVLLLSGCVTLPPESAAPSYPSPQEQAEATPLPSVPLGPDLASPEAIWTLRSALNVAALACPERSIAERYNRLLKQHASLFADAYAAEQLRYQMLYGRTWQARQDREMTALYNRYANPTRNSGFCAAAAAVSADAIEVPEDKFGYFAAAALDRLNAPPPLASVAR